MSSSRVQACRKRAHGVGIQHVQVHAAAQLALMFGERRGKIVRRSADTWQGAGVKSRRQRLGIMDIGRTDDGEGQRCRGPGDIGAFKQAGAYVEQSRFVVGDVGAGHDPRRAPGRGALAALPAGAGYDGKVAAKSAARR